MSPPWKKRPVTSVIGLVLARDRLEAVELRRTNGSVEIRQSISVPLESDPFAGDPTAAGLALRQRLSSAGFRETACAVSLPPEIILSLSVAVPDLPDVDRDSFLEIEAERGFPQGVEDLVVATSVTNPKSGPRHATLLAVPRTWIQHLERILAAARLRPVSFAPGLSLLQPAATEANLGTLALLPAGSGLAAQITTHGGITGCRVVDNAFSGDPAQPHFDPDHVVRELRITLGQLPAGIRSELRRVRVFGRGEASRLAAERLRPFVEPLGLSFESVTQWTPAGLPFRLPADAPASPAFALAATVLTGARPTLEFLPPRVSAWQQLVARYPSGRLAWAGGAVGACAAVVALAFLGQQFLLWRWESRWDAMKTRVKTLEGIQKEIRLYRPWFDESARSLSILRRLTEAFPEDGSVTAKALEIRTGNRVTCSGTARDGVAWLKMLDQLRNGRGIADVQVVQVRGKAPLEFTLNFRWEGPGGS